MTTKPCTLAPKHKWTFDRNVTQGTFGPGTLTMSVRGLYRCACGATRIGAANQNAPGADIREHLV